MRHALPSLLFAMILACGGGGSGDDVDGGSGGGDPDASLFDCVDDVDCGDGEICKGNECIPAGCEDDLITGNESDIDCGGDCLPCANNFLCNEASDCESLFCTPSFRCGACQSQVDCGAVPGTFCDGSACVDTQPNGTMCSSGYECTSGICDLADSNLCEAANVCGNGVIEDGENCDDGNTVAGDTCESDCSLGTGQSCTTDGECGTGVCDTAGSGQCEAANVCGNGKVEGAEVCDDGNTSNGDGCQSNCTLANGSGCTLDGQCYSGHCDQLGSSTCESANTCGNGTVEGLIGESCDDGNTTNGDGCESNCKLTNGQGCTNDSQCSSGVCDTQSSGECEAANVCGNGKVESGEYCDDGNTTNNDGCSSTCKLYSGASCSTNAACTSGDCGDDSKCCSVNCSAQGSGTGVCYDGTCRYTSTRFNDNDCSPHQSNNISFQGKYINHCIFGFPTSGTSVEAIAGGGSQTCAQLDANGVWTKMSDNDGWSYTTAGTDRWYGELNLPPDGLSYTSCYRIVGESVSRAVREYTNVVERSCTSGCNSTYMRCDTTETPDRCEALLTCGNGLLETGYTNPGIPGGTEECDDGNHTNGDGCNASCILE